MSHHTLHSSAPAAGPQTKRSVLESLSSYDEAELVVDRLAERDFPVEHVSIEARGLRFVEQVTGRDSAGLAARRGAAGGLVFGALFGLLFGLLAWNDPVFSGLVLAAYGGVLGTIVGAITGAVGFRARDGRHEFRTASTMRADAYDVMVEDAHLDAARAVLGQDPTRPG